MRNIVYLFVLSFGLFFYSCSSKEQKVGPGVLKTVETAVFCTQNVPSTAPRYGCNGERIEGQKITGWTAESTESIKTVPCNFTDKDLKAAGYSFTGTHATASRPARVEEEGFTPIPDSGNKISNSLLNIPWEWLGWLVFIAIMLAVLLALLWLLREIADWLFSQRIVRNNHQSQEGVLQDRATGQPIGGGSQNPPINQQSVATPPNGTWVPAGYMLLPSGAVVVPHNGIYLGIRNPSENLIAEIYTPQPVSPATDEKPKTNII